MPRTPRTLRADRLVPGDRIEAHGEIHTIRRLSERVDSAFVTVWATDGAPVCLLPEETVPLIESAPPCPEMLPDLPSDPFRMFTGYDWIARLAGGWHDVALWGVRGWDLGGWPLQVVAHCHVPERDVYGQALYVEGDVYADAFATREDLHRATTHTALHCWESLHNGPEELRKRGAAEEMIESGRIPAAYCVPYSRLDAVPAPEYPPQTGGPRVMVEDTAEGDAR